MPISTLYNQLREGCKLTGAAWAAWVEQDAPTWIVREYHGLSRAKFDGLLSLLNEQSGRGWLDRALASRRVRSRAADGAALGCSRLYAFPAEQAISAILAGAERLDPSARRVWRLAAFGGEQVQRYAKLEEDLQTTQQELQARIAAQAAAEQRLIQAAKLAAVGEMAAGVAHELNNPLTTIVGFTELVMDDLPEDSASRTDLETIMREALRARDVVRRLLDFSRRSEMVRVKANINAIVSDSLALVRHLLSTGGVKIHVSLDDTLPWAFVDRDQMKQVLLNLLHNALNAMPHGGRVDIRSSSRKKYGKDWITISVEDTGVGIPPENMERIFEPFFTTRAGEGGTGLGLAVTYGIVSSHGGMIEAESAEGAGATFTVWLPLEDK